MATIALKFGTFALSSTNQITISSWSEKEKKTAKTFNIPKTDGSIAETGRRQELQVKISGDIVGTSYTDLRTNIDALKAALQDGKQKITKDDERYVIGQLRDFQTTQMGDRTHPTVVSKWDATFIAEYPFWLSETLTTDTRVPTSGAGYTIANGGNAPTRVKATFTAPGGGISNDIQMENTTRSELFKYLGDVTAAQVLEVDNRVDTAEFEVLNNAVDDHTNFEGDFLNLSSGNNTIEFTGTAGTSITLSYRNAWY